MAAAKLFGYTELLDKQGKPITDPGLISQSRCLAMLSCVENFFESCAKGAERGENEEFVKMQTFVLTLNLSTIVECDLPRLKKDIDTLSKLLGFEMEPPLIHPATPMSKEVH